MALRPLFSSNSAIAFQHATLLRDHMCSPIMKIDHLVLFNFFRRLQATKAGAEDIDRKRIIRNLKSLRFPSFSDFL